MEDATCFLDNSFTDVTGKVIPAIPSVQSRINHTNENLYKSLGSKKTSFEVCLFMHFNLIAELHETIKIS